MNKYCGCGCGEVVRHSHNNYIHGHHNKKYNPNTPESAKKISKSLLFHQQIKKRLIQIGKKEEITRC